MQQVAPGEDEISAGREKEPKMACRICLLLVSLVLPSFTLGADLLEVATATVDITGPVGYKMAGYSAREGASEGVHDPLLAKALLLRSGDEELAIITYDLIAFPSERVARVAHEELGIDHVLNVASHTHSGPSPASREKMFEDPYFREVEDKALELLREARSKYVSARMVVTETSSLLGHNRRKVHADGSVEMFWRNAEKEPTAPVDPTVGILRFTDEQDNVLAVLVHFACHPVVLGPDNLDYSADYPGFMYRYVEEQLGGDAVCFFLPGAAGDINPYYDKQPVSEDGFGVARDMGEKLGAAVIEALGSLPDTSPLEPDLRIHKQFYHFKHRFPADSSDAETEIPVEVAHILLAKEVGLVAIPGEVFVSHQIDLRTRSPLRYTFLVGFANSGRGTFAGYIPTIQAAMEGGYGADYATRVEVGAGERMIDRAVIKLGEWTGKLSDKPGR